MDRFHIALFSAVCLFAGCPPSQAQTMSQEEVRGWLKGQAILDEDHVKDWSDEKFFMLVGKKKTYAASDILTYKPPPAAGQGVVKQGWQPVSVKIRENFDDVLAAEDPSQDGKDDASDLNGASFSYSRNYVKDQDTWQGKGSLIFPFIWQGSDTPGAAWHLESGGLTPSISLEKLVTEGDADDETDSLVYRLGGFLNWAGPIGPNGSGRMENRVRGYFSYGTSTDHDVSIPAAELEYEPRFDWGGKFAIGHWRALAWRKGYNPESPTFKRHEDVLLAYQWRIYLKGQFGEVSDAADAPDLTEGTFARLGPVTELKLDPLFLKRLSFNVRYQYLIPLDGPDSSPDRFDASLAWTLWQDVALNRRVSIKATYINGPLDFREGDEESLLLGFGITF